MMIKNQPIILLLIFLIQVSLLYKEVRGYPTGAGSCDAPSLKDHGNATENNNDFELILLLDNYDPLTEGVLRLEAKVDKKFKGFQIISEDVSFFELDEYARFNNLTDCDDKSRVTHSNNTDKEKVSIKFKLPEEPKNFNITYYVVQDKETWFGPLELPINMISEPLEEENEEEENENENEEENENENEKEEEEDDDDDDDDGSKDVEGCDVINPDNDDDDGEDDDCFSVANTGCEVSDDRPNYSCRVKLSDDFVLYWKHEELEDKRRRKILKDSSTDAGDSLLEMALLAKTDGWIGFAFSENSGKMFPADAIIAWIDEDNTTSQTQTSSYRITSYKIEDIKQDNNLGITQKSLTKEDSYLFLEFTKNLKLGNIQSNTLDKDFNINFAVGSTHSLSEHTIKGSSKLNLYYGHYQKTSNSKTVYKFHASLMILSWLLILPLGISVARSKWSFNNNSQKNLWMLIHIALQGIGVFLVVISFFIGLLKLNEANTSRSALHGILGIITTVILLVHLIIAIFRPSPESNRRNMFNKIHQWTGRIVIIIACVTILSGLNTFNKDHDGNIKALVAFVVIFSIAQIVIAIFAEIRKIKNEKSKSNINAEIGLGVRVETIPETQSA